MQAETIVASTSNDLTGADASLNGQYTILFALWLLVFSASSQLMIVVAMLPEIGEQLSISTARQGFLVSSYAVMVGVFALVAGPVSDKFGRRRMLLVGSGLMTAAFCCHACQFCCSIHSGSGVREAGKSAKTSVKSIVPPSGGSESSPQLEEMERFAGAVIKKSTKAAQI